MNMPMVAEALAGRRSDLGGDHAEDESGRKDLHDAGDQRGNRDENQQPVEQLFNSSLGVDLSSLVRSRPRLAASSARQRRLHHRKWERGREPFLALAEIHDASMPSGTVAGSVVSLRNQDSE